MSKTAERAVLVVLAVGLVCGLGVGKEPAKKAANIDSLVASGMKSYKAGKINEAITHFQKVISELQALVTGKLEQYFPKLPPQWVAGKVKSDSIAMSGRSSAAYSTVRRTYTRTTDKARVDITLTNSPQIMGPQQMMLQTLTKNPAMLAMMNKDPKKQFTLIDQDGWSGWSVVEKGRNRAETTAMTKSCMVNIRVSKAEAAVLDMVWKGMDRKGLAGTGGGATK